jgi:hypothetical protein
MDILKTQLLARLDTIDTHKKPAGPTLPAATAS